MGTRRVGFVGGCLAAIRHVGLSELYHRVLARRFADRGIRMSVALEGYDEPGELILAARRLLEERKVDVLVVQVRPHPLVRDAWLLWWRVGEGRRRSVALHPALWDRTVRDYDERGFDYAAAHVGWQGDGLRHDSAELEDVARAPGHLRRWLKKGNINSILGAAAGLHHWAYRRHLAILREVQRLCGAAKTPLIVIGPMPIPILPAADIVRRRLDRRLAAELRAEGVPYLRVERPQDPAGRDMLLADAQHVGPLGHAYLAELLEPRLAEVFEARASDR